MISKYDHNKIIFRQVFNRLYFYHYKMNISGKTIQINNFNYQLIKLIGEGSTAQVYEAINLNDNSDCAIKISYSPRNQLQMKYMKDEIRLHRSFAHKNIIKYYDDQIIQGKCVYLVMQKGEYNLRKYCEEKGISNTLNQKQSVIILVDIIKAVSQLQYKKIIHRDIKTQNIVYKEGSFKLVDFGISINLRDKLGTNTVVGTPLFYAPQIIDQKFYDSKVDIWCLGIILFQIYFGEVPFYLSNNFTPMRLKNVIQEICVPEFDFDKLIKNYERQKIKEEKIFFINSKRQQASKHFIDFLKNVFVFDPKKRLNINQVYQHPLIKTTCPITYKHMNNQMQIIRVMTIHINFLELTIKQIRQLQNNNLHKKCISSLELAVVYFLQKKYKPNSVFTFDLSQQIEVNINKSWKQVKEMIKKPLIQAYKCIKNICTSHKLKILLFRILVCMQSHRIFETYIIFLQHFQPIFGEYFNQFQLQEYLDKYLNKQETHQKLIKCINFILEKYYTISMISN